MLELEVLSRAECVRHLRAEAVGRAAVCTPSGPHIVPINYTLTDDEILMVTASTSILGKHAPSHAVGLEIDGISPLLHAGWSVVVRGEAEAVRAAEHVAALRSWVPRHGDVVLRLTLADCDVTGRLLPARPLRQ